MADNNSGDAGAAGNQNTSWKDALPDELKTYKGLEKFKEPADVVRSYRTLEVSLAESGRADAIIPPKADATKEKWDEYFTKLGRPAASDKYEIKLSDELAGKVNLSDADIQQIKQTAFDQGLTQKQAQALLEATANAQATASDRIKIETDSKFNQASTELKARWGDKYDEQLQLTKNMLNRFLPPDLREKVGEVSNNPVIVEAFYNMSKLFKEDTLLGESQEHGAINHRAEAQKLMESDAYKNPRHPDHEMTKDRVRSLYKQANPKK